MLASWRTFGTNTCRPRSARQRSTARTVGRATDPRRAFEAGDRGGSNHGRAVHGSGSSPAFAVLEYVPPKPRRGYCFNRFFVIPTATFRLLFGLVILRHDRRYLFHLAVISNPTADWLARQISEAVPWDTAPNLIRDRDGAYGQVFRRRVRAMGIGDRPTAPGSPWQNATVERLIRHWHGQFCGKAGSDRSPNSAVCIIP